MPSDDGKSVSWPMYQSVLSHRRDVMKDWMFRESKTGQTSSSLCLLCHCTVTQYRYRAKLLNNLCFADTETSESRSHTQESQLFLAFSFETRCSFRELSSVLCQCLSQLGTALEDWLEHAETAATLHYLLCCLYNISDLDTNCVMALKQKNVPYQPNEMNRSIQLKNRPSYHVPIYILYSLGFS